jgi:transposase
MKRRVKRDKLRRREVPVAELEAILARARVAALSEEDCAKLKGAVDTLAFLTRELEAKGASVDRLRRMLFGPSSEKTSRVVGEAAADAAQVAHGAETENVGASDAAGSSTGESGAEAGGETPKDKRKGHGRNGAAAYRGATRVKVSHESLATGDPCPGCKKGKLYPQAEPAVLVRVTGMAPLSAVVYELERLRCNLCGEVFKARAPDGVGESKYDETAAAMIALLRYGCGLPFNRLQRLQEDLGIPLPAATQWEVAKRAADLVAPAYEELIRQAAQGEVLHNDDTTMRILELMAPPSTGSEADDNPEDRTGIFTSGIVATGAGHRIALFFTGRQHAGENLADVLARRAAELPRPIQMCDALAANTAGDLDTIVANCIAHARRRFVDVAGRFPDECRHVLELLRQVYVADAAAARQAMSPDERLRFHQEKSAPVMDSLRQWLHEQIADHRVEPNSPLGDAIGYMQRHWDKLTLFLHVPGAPLDNNVVERSLKRAIMHRKNSLFYKTANGALVGDTFMSLIHSAELCAADPFDYLVALQKHHDLLAADPAARMPWSYRQALTAIAQESTHPA